MIKKIRIVQCFVLHLCFFSLQYNAVDTNPLSVYVMQPIWNKIIKVRVLFNRISRDNIRIYFRHKKYFHLKVHIG